MLIMTGEYKEECGTCALIAEGSTMPYSDNTCPQVTNLTSSILVLPPSCVLSTDAQIDAHKGIALELGRYTMLCNKTNESVLTIITTITIIVTMNFQCGADTTQLTEGEQNPC